MRFDDRHRPIGAPIDIRVGRIEGPFGVSGYDVALDDAGRFVVAWRESLGAELDPATEIEVGIDDDGQVVVAWTGQDGAHAVQLFRRYRLTCAPGYEQRCPSP